MTQYQTQRRTTTGEPIDNSSEIDFEQAFAVIARQQPDVIRKAFRAYWDVAEEDTFELAVQALQHIRELRSAREVSEYQAEAAKEALDRPGAGSARRDVEGGDAEMRDGVQTLVIQMAKGEIVNEVVDAVLRNLRDNNPQLILSGTSQPR